MIVWVRMATAAMKVSTKTAREGARIHLPTKPCTDKDMKAANIINLIRTSNCRHVHHFYNLFYFCEWCARGIFFFFFALRSRRHSIPVSFGLCDFTVAAQKKKHEQNKDRWTKKKMRSQSNICLHSEPEFIIISLKSHSKCLNCSDITIKRMREKTHRTES